MSSYIQNKMFTPLAIIVFGFGVLFFLAGFTSFSNIVFYVFGAIIVIFGIYLFMKMKKGRKIF